MNKKKVPYNTQVQFAIMAGKSDEAHDVIGRALAEMGNGALEFAQSYPFDDGTSQRICRLEKSYIFYGP